MGNGPSCHCASSSCSDRELTSRRFKPAIHDFGNDPYRVCNESITSTDVEELFTENFKVKLNSDHHEVLFINRESIDRALIIRPGNQIYNIREYTDFFEGFSDFSTLTIENLFEISKRDLLGQHESIYVGAVDGDSRHGYGLELWANGNSYTGEYKQGDRHGYGTFLYFDGSQYCGTFVMGSMEGFGKLVSRYKVVYSGGFKDNLKHGHGSELWPDGRRFVGVFSKGARTRRGRFYSISGEIAGVP